MNKEETKLHEFNILENGVTGLTLSLTKSDLSRLVRLTSQLYEQYNTNNPTDSLQKIISTSIICDSTRITPVSSYVSTSSFYWSILVGVHGDVNLKSINRFNGEMNFYYVGDLITMQDKVLEERNTENEMA